MKRMMRYAALLAALVLALGLVELMRPGVATANEDFELLRLPSNKGDPDDGGPSRIFGITLTSWFASARRSLALLGASAARQPIPRGPRVSPAARQTWTRRQ